MKLTSPRKNGKILNILLVKTYDEASGCHKGVKRKSLI